MASPSPDHRLKYSPPSDYRSPADTPPATFPLPLPLFECKDGVKSSWKFSKEAPRLSLDSRASVDNKGKIRINPAAAVLNDVVATSYGGDDKRRSPSVIAKLMGLDQLPNNNSLSTPEEPIHNAELRRSASESRVSRDYGFTESSNNNNNYHVKQQNQFLFHSRDNAGRENAAAGPPDPLTFDQAKPSHRGSVWKLSQQQHRKSFFDSTDIFPEPKQTGDMERRLKMRGIEEASSKDLEALKQILEAMQLKGLLHSKNKVSSEQQQQIISQRNFVYERRCFNNSYDQSPIVVMKPSGPPKRLGNNLSSRNGVGRNLNNSGEYLPPSMSPRRERSRNSSSPTRRESSNNARSPCSSPARRRALTVETQRKGGNNEYAEQRRASPDHSPRPSPRRNGSDQVVRLPRNGRWTAEIAPSKEKICSIVLVEDDSSSFSESNVSTSSHTDEVHNWKKKNNKDSENANKTQITSSK